MCLDFAGGLGFCDRAELQAEVAANPKKIESSEP